MNAGRVVCQNEQAISLSGNRKTLAQEKIKMKTVGLRINCLVYLVMLMALAGFETANAQTVSTFVSGLSEPNDVAFDSTGNMYVAAMRSNKILKVTPAGGVSTFAGSGTYGSQDGPGATAQFAFPTHVTVDSTGNVYVLDSDPYYPIRKITRDGTVSTLKPAIRILSTPPRISNTLVVDPAGNLFFFWARELYKFTPTGQTTIVAGSFSNSNIVDGVGTSAYFRNPTGLAIDSQGNLYTLDFNEASGTRFVRKITPNYTVSSIALSEPRQLVDVAVDSTGTLYITGGSVSKNIVKVNNVSAVSIHAGTGAAGATDGPASSATFASPCGAAIFGNFLYVADSGNGKIRKVDVTLLTRKNVALASNGGVASASSTGNETSVPSSATINGEQAGTNWAKGSGGWQDATKDVYPDWVQIDFNGLKSIEEINVFTTQTNYVLNPVTPTPTMTTSSGIKDFEVQYWNGSSWVTVPNGTVTGNTLVWRKFTFSAIPTSKIRVQINNAPGSSRITEIEAWGLN